MAHGQSFFEMMRDDPAKADDFARFMTATTALAEQFIFSSHDFAPFSLAVDVGGNHGSLLLRMLSLQPAARGILFDLPTVTALAPPVLAAHPNGARVEVVSGSFFESVPAGGDLYLLKQILHDWKDPECLAILRNIRAAIAPGGRLAVVDRLMPEEIRPHPSYKMDLYMMLLLGAQERKLSEFEALFAQSGFRLDKVSEDDRVPQRDRGRAGLTFMKSGRGTEKWPGREKGGRSPLVHSSMQAPRSGCLNWAVYRCRSSRPIRGRKSARARTSPARSRRLR